MNIKEKTLELNRQHKNEDTDINDLLLTIVTSFQLFEPCRYLDEDDDWINVLMLSFEDDSLSQAMSIRKSEITMFGIFNPLEIPETPIKNDSEDFYQ